MDGTVLGLYLLAAFLGGLTTGIAGFALGLVVSAIWLHIISPLQTAILISCYGLLTQGYGIWKVRHVFEWRTVSPYILGGAFGVPAGAMLLSSINPDYMRTGIGVLLAVYSIYGLARPVFKPVRAGLPSDLGIGFLNGVLGGMTGLAGLIITIWCQMKGLPKDGQRAVFQPVLFVVLAMSAVSLALGGAVTAETVKLYLLGLPVLLIGTWIGFKLYGRLDDAAFRKIILVLLLVSGLALIVPMH